MQKITVIACNNKMPAWVDEGCKEYLRRLQEYTQINVIEIPLHKRGKISDLNRLLEKEALQMKQAIPVHSYVFALAIQGKSYTSEQWADKLESLQLYQGHLCFLIGGPEGLTEAMITRANEKLSLSSLTMPHTIARLVFFESLYRAYAIMNHHPYHK